MKKIILLVLTCSMQTFPLTVEDANKLENEFRSIGIYDQNDPTKYNETRAAEILNELQQSKTFRSRVAKLRNAQLESLQQRSIRRAGPGEALSCEEQLEQCRQELQQAQNNNQQLIDHATELIDAFNNLRSMVGNIDVAVSYPVKPNEARALTRDALNFIDHTARLRDNLLNLIP